MGGIPALLNLEKIYLTFLPYTCLNIGLIGISGFLRKASLEICCLKQKEKKVRITRLCSPGLLAHILLSLIANPPLSK